ncbi:MAG: 50S ribosomal protein L29 [bacterium]|nr:50S ribosomal protein L29 [bacterium]
MKASELRQQSKSTLETTLRDFLTKQFQLKMKHGSGQLAANHHLRQVRRDIARVNTLMTELEKKGE